MYRSMAIKQRLENDLERIGCRMIEGGDSKNK